MQKPVLTIDGNHFSTPDEFYDEVQRVLIPDAAWGRNPDAFNDVLRSGFETPKGGFVLVWRHSRLSRERLGYGFDMLVEVIREHGPGGLEAGDGVDLQLR